MYGVCTYSFHDRRVGARVYSADAASLPADILIDCTRYIY